MVDSAEEARRVAAISTAALRLVNEKAAECLIAAAGRGETRARVDLDTVRIPFAAGSVGRLYDRGLIDVLEGGGERVLARACRIFDALGFTVTTAPDPSGRAEATDATGDIGITHVELGFATAEEKKAAASQPLLQAVMLPAAHLWRTRAETTRRIEGCERKALALIAEQAERGIASCRLAWRSLASGPPDTRLLQQLAERLRGRGFGVEPVEHAVELRVHW